MDLSVFEIAGPIMVGPSSSHTAGACKIGQMARALFHHTPEKVTFYLHGSFATVYKGHATDRALLAGIMKFKTGDVRIKNSFKIASNKKIEYIFKTIDLGQNAHPNTVKIVLEKKRIEPMTIVGSSLGGGVAKIVQINQFNVDLYATAGMYKTFVVWHDNNEKVLTKLINNLERKNIIIESIHTEKVSNKALSILNLEGKELTLKELIELEGKIKGIESIRSLLKLQKN